MFKIACIAAAVAALTTPALAQQHKSFASAQPVPVAGTDFRSPAAVQDLYGRLKVAATNVCSLYVESARITDVDQVCVQRALSDAVRAADRPQLSALHDGERALATRAPSASGGLQ